MLCISSETSILTAVLGRLRLVPDTVMRGAVQQPPCHNSSTSSTPPSRQRSLGIGIPSTDCTVHGTSITIPTVIEGCHPKQTECLLRDLITESITSNVLSVRRIRLKQAELPFTKAKLAVIRSSGCTSVKVSTRCWYSDSRTNTL